MTASELAAMGKEKFFNSLYCAYYDKVLQCAHFYLYKSNKGHAEDVVQEVFVKVWKQIDRLRIKISSPANWESYLFIMTRNHSINYQRKKATEEPVSWSTLNKANEVVYDDPILDRECQAILMKAMNRLTKRQKEIYLLKFYGFNARTIATGLQISTQTVSNILTEAGKRVQDYVGKQLNIKTNSRRALLPAA